MLSKLSSAVRRSTLRKGRNNAIVNATIVKGVNNILNEEALRVILKMPNWEPALRNGNAISSEINLPLIYIRQ